MMKLYAKLKKFSWKQNFDIFNAHEEIVYKAKGQHDFFGRRKVSILDMNDNELAFLKQRSTAWTMIMDVYVNNALEMTIRKKALTMRPQYTIDGKDWIVEGSFLQYDYVIKENNRVIARVSKKALSWSETFEIDIQDRAADVVDILSIVLTIHAQISQGSVITATL